MPYASTAELPADVRGVLPDAAQALFLKVVNAALNAGESDSAAAQIAWRGLGNAGWVKGADGMYGQAAPKRMAVAKRAGTEAAYTLRVPVTKAEGTDDEVEVSGWASVALDASGAVIVDHDREIIPVPVLKAAARDFLARSREFNAVDHYSQPCGALTESVVMDPATRVAMGLDGSGPTGWWVSATIRGPAAKRVRSGELREFSIEATAIKRRNPDNTVTFLGLTVDRVTLVDAGAGIGVRIEAAKSRQKVTKNMDAILAKLAGVLSPEELKMLQDALAGAQPAGAEMEIEPAEMAKAQEAVAAHKKRADDAEAARDAALKALKDRDAEAAMTAEQREEAALKKLDPSVREIVLKSRSDAKAARDALAKRDEEDAQRVAKSRAESLKAIPGATIEEMARALRAVDTLTAKAEGQKSAAEIIGGMLAEAAKALKASPLLNEIGSPRAAEGSAEARMDAKIAEIIASDPELKKLDPKVAKKRATPIAYERNPELYAQLGSN